MHILAFLSTYTVNVMGMTSESRLSIRVSMIQSMSNFYQEPDGSGVLFRSTNEHAGLEPKTHLDSLHQKTEE